MIECNKNKVREYYQEMTDNTSNYWEFAIAFLLYERAYTVDSADEITEEEIEKLAKIVEGYDSIINDNLGEDIDDLINYPREHDSLYDD